MTTAYVIAGYFIWAFVGYLVGRLSQRGRSTVDQRGSVRGGDIVGRDLVRGSASGSKCEFCGAGS